ncbi:MAG: DUF4252 domain-containing protein [Phaeodactylibacter sp.]|nr:DUF4252 domain-containing protein [Phaeodactylibacter sp.]
MKYLAAIFTFCFLAFAGTATFAQDGVNDAISKYFTKYLDDERFTVVYISPKMFSLFKKMDVNLDDDEAEAIMEVVDDLKSLRILVCEDESYTNTLFKEATSSIDTKEYEVLMTVRNKNEEKVDFLIKDEGDTINELLLLVGGGDTFVLMSFVGNINLDKISKLAEAFEDDDEPAEQHMEKGKQ